MGDADRGQVTATAADVYDEFFVPALFAQWTDVVLDAAGVRRGHRVLDVGCGTGILARAAHARGASVIAVDPNDGMLAVAQGAAPEIDWRNGVAEQLPLADREVDRTVSQFALMFFTDQKAAMAELARVTRADGRIAVAVWDALERNPGYARLAALLDDLFGVDAGDALRAPFRLGDRDALSEMAAAGIEAPTVTTHDGIARFDSLDAWLHTEIRGWTLADVIDDEGFARLVEAARRELGDLAGARSAVVFPVTALVVSGAPR
jgi:SAM-dependent methyltransferase